MCRVASASGGRKSDRMRSTKPKAARSTADLLTRAEVARILRCSVTRVIQYQRASRLRPVKVENGTNFFARTEVLAFARSRRAPRVLMFSGELAAEVFALFEERIPLAQIVIATREPPEVIRALYDEYLRPLGSKATKAGAAVEGLDEYFDRLRAQDDERRKARRARLRGSE